MKLLKVTFKMLVQGAVATFDPVTGKIIPETL
jgi:hypothetical protein